MPLIRFSLTSKFFDLRKNSYQAIYSLLPGLLLFSVVLMVIPSVWGAPKTASGQPSSGTVSEGAKRIPEPPSSYVYNENIISEEAARELGHELRTFELRTGHQFVVGLFQSLERESLEDYVNQVFKAWKVGDAKRNDGLLFCMFQKERRWRIEVGYGLEPVLTDLEAHEIVQKLAVPYFKEGNVDAGVMAVVQGIGLKLEGMSLGSGGVPLPSEIPGGGDNAVPLGLISKILGLFLVLCFFWFWYSFEQGYDWNVGYTVGSRVSSGPRYPLRFFFILWLFFFLLLRIIWELLTILAYTRGGGGYYSGGDSWGGGGGGFGGGGFSGGGGSSGGGGASGGW